MANEIDKSTSPAKPEEGEVMPKELEAKVRRMAISITESYSGPFPHPKILNQYKPADKKIIFAQAKAQMQHRQKLEKTVIESNIRHGGKAMVYAFWITVLMIVAGVALILAGKSTEGLVALFAPAGFQAGNYVYQKYREMRDVGEKVKKENNKQVRKIGK